MGFRHEWMWVFLVFFLLTCWDVPGGAGWVIAETRGGPELG